MSRLVAFPFSGPVSLATTPTRRNMLISKPSEQLLTPARLRFLLRSGAACKHDAQLVSDQLLETRVGKKWENENLKGSRRLMIAF